MRANLANPEVEKSPGIQRRDLAYCDMGQQFSWQPSQRREHDIFAPMYMTSQLAGVMDHSFSWKRNGRDGFRASCSSMLVKSPEMIVDVVIWLQQSSVSLTRANPRIRPCEAASRRRRLPAGYDKVEVGERRGDQHRGIDGRIRVRLLAGIIYRLECCFTMIQAMVYALSANSSGDTYDRCLPGMPARRCAGRVARDLQAAGQAFWSAALK